MKRRGLLVALLIVVFFALRLALLAVRQPFFDELFTVWITRKSFAGILDALRLDSGPPLYYFVVRMFGGGSVLAARVLSLIFATAGFAALLAARQYLAAAFVAVFPPSVLFSVDARAYAICAMFVTFAVLALDRKKPWAACGALMLAAYSHYYAVLFFPLFWRHWRALLVALLAFAPGFWLAFHQPAEALAWRQGVQWPDALLVRPPMVVISVVAILIAAVALRRAAVPLLLSIIAGVYVPLRFEGVAAPLLGIDMRAKRVVFMPLLAICLAISIWGIADHAQRPLDDYQVAAAWLARNVPPNEHVVASGYLYLPTVVVGRTNASSFPAEQAQHPGWRASLKTGEQPPKPPFIWIGERQAPELRMLGRTEPLYVNERAMVARIR